MELKLAGFNRILVTHQPDKSWLKTPAPYKLKLRMWFWIRLIAWC